MADKTPKNDVPLNREDLKAQRKALKEEQKAQRKEARARARELDEAEEDMDDNSGSGGVLLITFIIVVVWLAILGLLIKLDVGGFGSTVLAPVLKNVPVINKILPAEKMPNAQISTDKDGNTVYYGYSTLEEAVNQIKFLEQQLEGYQQYQAAEQESVKALQEEIQRLKTFENNQIAFETIKNQFYKEVVYAEKGPGAEEYKKYYEAMDPTTAENIYRQVIIQEENDAKVKEYAAAYSAMKAKEAAAIFESMQDDLPLAAKILNAMGSDDRGAILGAMDSTVAARLTQIMEPNEINPNTMSQISLPSVTQPQSNQTAPQVAPTTDEPVALGGGDVANN